MDLKKYQYVNEIVHENVTLSVFNEKEYVI